MIGLYDLRAQKNPNTVKPALAPMPFKRRERIRSYVHGRLKFLAKTINPVPLIPVRALTRVLCENTLLQELYKLIIGHTDKLGTDVLGVLSKTGGGPYLRLGLE